MPLHPGQIKYIEDTFRGKTKVNTLVPANRFGKSSMIACMQIHCLFYKRGIPEGNKRAWLRANYRTANIAPSSPLVEPVFQYIDQIMTSSFPIRLPDGRLITNKCQIEWFYLKDRTLKTPHMKQFFANNAFIEHRTIGLSGADSLEGKPYGMITYDEAGRSDHLEREMNGTLLARLFDLDGQLHLVSTPDQNSPSILYHYEVFNKGKNKLPGFYTMEGELKDNIFFPREQIEKQYELYADNPLKDQVLYGKFVFGGDNLYKAEDIIAAKDESLNDGERFRPGRNYVIATDTAIGADEMVHSVLDITDLKVERTSGNFVKVSGMARLVRQIAAKGNSKSPQAHLNDFIDLYDSYSDDHSRPMYMLETWNGESVRYYHDLPDYIKTKTKCYGTWQPLRRQTDNANREKPKNQSAKKADILMALGKLLYARALKIPSIDNNIVLSVSGQKAGADLIQQLTIYKEDDNNLPTDRIMSLALAAWIAQSNEVHQQEIAFVDW